MRNYGVFLIAVALAAPASAPASAQGVDPFKSDSTWPGARPAAAARIAPQAAPSRLLPPGAATGQARPPRPATAASATANAPSGPAQLDGGARPSIGAVGPQSIAYSGGQSAGTVVIDTSGRQLLLVTSGTSALRYPISVGREGFTWTGTQKISRVADWPDWRPPAEMRQRDPRLPEVMTGGLRNPLGAKALYLGGTLYRIHGTNDVRSIGQAASSGCFRMTNGNVVDLANRVGVGTTVVVVGGLPATAFSGGGRGRQG